VERTAANQNRLPTPAKASIENRRNIKDQREEAEEDRPEPKLSWIGVLMLTLSWLSLVLSVCGTGADVLHQVGTGAAPMFKKTGAV
jgi:hypothetical protein